MTYLQRVRNGWIPIALFRGLSQFLLPFYLTMKIDIKQSHLDEWHTSGFPYLEYLYRIVTGLASVLGCGCVTLDGVVYDLPPCALDAGLFNEPISFTAKRRESCNAINPEWMNAAYEFTTYRNTNSIDASSWPLLGTLDSNPFRSEYTAPQPTTWDTWPW